VRIHSRSCHIRPSINPMLWRVDHVPFDGNMDRLGFEDSNRLQPSATLLAKENSVDCMFPKWLHEDRLDGREFVSVLSKRFRLADSTREEVDCNRSDVP
jgi:hypothetical protein